MHRQDEEKNSNQNTSGHCTSKQTNEYKWQRVAITVRDLKFIIGQLIEVHQNVIKKKYTEKTNKHN